MPQLASVVKQHFWKSFQSLQFPWFELRWSGLCGKHFLPSVPTWHLSFPYYRNIEIIFTSSWWLSYEIRKENVIPHFMRKQKTIFRFISQPINSGPCGSLVCLLQISLPSLQLCGCESLGSQHLHRQPQQSSKPIATIPHSHNTKLPVTRWSLSL